MGGSGSKRDSNKRETNVDQTVDPRTATVAQSVEPGCNCLKISATSVDDFIVATTLGKGSFGRVRLAKHKESSTLWALKILKKKEILHHNAVEHVFREKKILAALSHPFIVYMAVAFDDSHHSEPRWRLKKS